MLEYQIYKSPNVGVCINLKNLIFGWPTELRLTKKSLFAHSFELLPKRYFCLLETLVLFGQSRQPLMPLRLCFLIFSSKLF